MKKKITSTQNPLIKHWVRLRKNRDYRDECQHVTIEGSKMVQEICKKQGAKCLILDEEKVDPEDWEGIEVEDLYLVSNEIMQKITGVLSPEGILAEVSLPKPGQLDSLSHIIVLDRLQDPGNVGSLIRTALALGWEGLFLLEPCCDPFNEKALRAAKGATFHLPLQIGHQEDLQALIQKHRGMLIAADLHGKSVKAFTSQKKKMLFLGNEAQGLSNEIKQLATCVTIPMSQTTESLNVAVAGGILMYALRSS